MNREWMIVMAVMMLCLPVSAWAGKGQGRGWGGEFQEKVKAHRQEQKAENQAFRETLKDKTPEERQALIKQHAEKQYNENVRFHDQLHSEKKQVLQEKLNESEKLTAEQKAEILAEFDSVYNSNKEKWAKMRAKGINYFEEIYTDQSLTNEQKREKVREYIQQERNAFKEYRKNEMQERKHKRAEFRDRVRERLGSSQDVE